MKDKQNTKHTHAKKKKQRKGLLTYMDGSRIFRRGGGVLTKFFCQRCIAQRDVRTSLEKQLDQMGPIVSRGGGGSVPVFLKKHIATWDFPGGPDPVCPSGSAHGLPCGHLSSTYSTIFSDPTTILSPSCSTGTSPFGLILRNHSSCCCPWWMKINLSLNGTPFWYNAYSAWNGVNVLYVK